MKICYKRKKEAKQRLQPQSSTRIERVFYSVTFDIYVFKIVCSSLGTQIYYSSSYSTSQPLIECSYNGFLSVRRNIHFPCVTGILYFGNKYGWLIYIIKIKIFLILFENTDNKLNTSFIYIFNYCIYNKLNIYFLFFYLQILPLYLKSI